MPEPGEFPALDPEASAGGPPQAFLSCSVLLCVCVCGGRGTGSLSGAAAVPAIPLSPQTQEAPFPPEAAVFLRQARGAAEGAAHAG